MKKRIWDLYAPIYKRAMKADQRILRLAGVRFEHQWSAREYLVFLQNHGWKVTFSREMAARIAMMYAECVKAGNER